MQAEFHNTNQDQFTFLVFDRASADTFFAKYRPLSHSNETLRAALRDKLLTQSFEGNKRLEEELESFHKNTEPLDTSNFNLAVNVLNSTLKQGGEKYFSGSLHYLFFYYCLPQKFRHKWSQSTLGHFEFNATFFDRLREKSKEFDNLIYGEEGYWDENMKFIFGEYIFNEITPEVAEKIKQAIVKDTGFNDQRFALDKVNFLEFLNKTITREWRLVLIDWD